MGKKNETDVEVCNRKIPYPSRAAAVRSKRHMKAEDLWVYHCRVGDHWHLGHPSLRNIAERRHYA